MRRPELRRGRARLRNAVAAIAGQLRAGPPLFVVLDAPLARYAEQDEEAETGAWWDEHFANYWRHSSPPTVAEE